MSYSLKHRDDPGTTTAQLLETILQQINKRTDVSLNCYGEIQTQTEKSPLYRLQSVAAHSSTSSLSIDSPILMLTTGFHGDEIAGPLTLMNYINEIFDFAHSKNVSLLIYPLLNPSGFNQRVRYDTISDERPNNDILWYQLKKGQWVGDIGASNSFKKWQWSDDYGRNLSLATRFLIKDVKKLPWNQIKAVLDIHQDLYFEQYPEEYTYSYCMGEMKPLRKIMRNSAKYVPLLQNTTIIDGKALEVTEEGDPIPKSLQLHSPKTDNSGIILRHDGTITDASYRHGVPYNIALETTSLVPLQKCDELHLYWIRELIDLIKKID